MNNLEILGAVLGVLNVWLIQRRSMWNYPFGIAMVVCYFYVFKEYGLYSDMLLQVFYFVVQFYGLYNWWNNREPDGLVQIEWMPNQTRWFAAGYTVVGILLLGWIMSTMQGVQAPYWDATVAGLSVTAQFLLSRRWIENWILWITVDLIAIPLYYSRDLTSTTVLYVIFLGLASYGFFSWYKSYDSRNGPRKVHASS